MTVFTEKERGKLEVLGTGGFTFGVGKGKVDNDKPKKKPPKYAKPVSHIQGVNERG